MLLVFNMLKQVCAMKLKYFIVDKIIYVKMSPVSILIPVTCLSVCSSQL